MPRTKFSLVLAMVLAALTAGCSFVIPAFEVEEKSTSERLAAIPTDGAPLHAPARIYFDDHQIPFIAAEDDRDLPFLLGLTHAHLRLAQMELFRAVAYGRTAELFGPPAKDIDKALRIVNFPGAVPKIAASLPEETRQWVERFVEGVNYYKARATDFSPEIEMLGGESGGDAGAWSLEDVLAVGRLACSDVNWLYWFTMLPLMGEPGWPELWAGILATGETAMPSMGQGEDFDLEAMALALKSGSNAVAVSGSRTASGAALLAGDTHVGLSLPPLWLITALSSPTINAVGLCLPGLPAVVVGRNQNIAWGGTNMLALSSSLYDAGDLAGEARERTEAIAVRWWPDTEFTVRETEVGPIITDAPQLKELSTPELALTWRGQRPSDELTPFLKVIRATNFEEFRQAFAPYAVSGQNFLYADTRGNIGEIMAVEFDPAAGMTGRMPIGDPADPAQRWGNPIPSLDLPHTANPPLGVIASANNVPVRSEPPVSIFGNHNDRYQRLMELALASEPMTVQAAMELQQDVHCRECLELARDLVEADKALGTEKSPQRAWLMTALAGWDGDFDTDSAGAAAAELAAFHVGKSVYTKRYGEKITGFLGSSPLAYGLVRQAIGSSEAAPDLDQALDAAAKDFEAYPAWGDLHHLRLAHPFANAPLVGDRFVYADAPIPGSTTTIYKTANKLSNEPHKARYGANARHISDLSDPDANWFSLLGGQDGYLGSANFLDLWNLWRKGEYVKIPLSREAAEQTFTHVITFTEGP